MINWMLTKVMNSETNEIAGAMLSQDYPTNPFGIVTVAKQERP